MVSLVGVGRDSAGDVRYSSARVNVTGPVSPHWSRNEGGQQSTALLLPGEIPHRPLAVLPWLTLFI